MNYQHSFTIRETRKKLVLSLNSHCTVIFVYRSHQYVHEDNKTLQKILFQECHNMNPERFDSTFKV